MKMDPVNSPTVLSTKKLSPSQRNLLLHAGLGFVEYDAISVTPISFDAPQNIENAIFTSSHAVKVVENSKITIENPFCVGEKTKSLLVENGQKVAKTAQNASELAHFIVKKHKNEQFLYFCGNRRREELPKILSENKVSFSEVVVYQTDLNLKRFDRTFDGILFFSPSGVESFTSENKIENTIAFCIGETTATEARRYADTIVIANTPTVESVIAKAAKTFHVPYEK